MLIKKAEIATVAVAPAQYPKDGLPEIALCGRSNVGKSSLINTLVNRRGLARTSSVPGKTRTINFFNINDALYLVDLPGYGYAKVSKEEKLKWGKMIEDYLNHREELRLVVLLVDIRHNPTADDKIMYDWMKNSGCKIVVVATKADKLSKNQLYKNIAMIKKELQLSQDDVFIPFSSETRQGKDELLAEIEKCCL
ncbi:GTP-binding protein EngB [Fervidicella metallireducens AeB]|uniref:Probable GTP-binding protein EngB n=1 Tax=Fervidicella metallireducens AeB TaxID=1403537 RepID=A0A017RW67_9CLOT|nr:ribosome biogenesis GTP-binding protein YihA/YsxC [Fervidicella metallireducens]EYE89003.1 GTP-binding protein EngB [Fervidicella metallireducens AeB]